MHTETKAKFIEAEAELARLKEKLQEYEAKLHSNEQLLQMTRNSKSSTTITRLTELEDNCKELKSKLNLSEKEIVSLKIQLEDSKFHLKQYCAISENTEKALHEANDTNEKLKKHYDEKERRYWSGIRRTMRLIRLRYYKNEKMMIYMVQKQLLFQLVKTYFLEVNVAFIL
jgi:chromosome segregation ATPase